jgi:leader peptidase (prepilin peptidase)/N-methyltransferase
MFDPLWLLLVFLCGTAVGSFLNVCIARLALEKSILWPSSHCGSCYQAIRWYDNLPLIAYVWLRGRCRKCGARFSIRYFLVELSTGLGFAGLFYLEVIQNIHQWEVPVRDAFAKDMGLYPWQWWLGWGFHATLFSFLVVAAGCDLDRREIPLSLTVTGTLVGLVGAAVFAWPWPYHPAPQGRDRDPFRSLTKSLNEHERRPSGDQPWLSVPIKEALYPWPIWGPVPAWAPGGTWYTGLLTGLAGALAGTLVLRGVAFLFGAGLGEEAMGLGDADLMMMAGAFMGWQPVLVAFLISVVPALFIGVGQLAIRRDNSLPFGPSLAIGVMTTILCWRWIGPQVQVLFFWGEVLLLLAGLGGAMLVGGAFLFRLLRRGEPQGA